jgi:uncharacterized protein YjlB
MQAMKNLLKNSGLTLTMSADAGMKMKAVAPATLFLPENDSMPNSARLPVLVYRKVFGVRTAEKHKLFQHRFEENGWKGIWKNGLYDYHHFHPASHEALGIASGTAEIQLGGDGGRTLTIESGDLLVLPAGTGHKRISASGNLVVIGAYPAGRKIMRYTGIKTITAKTSRPYYQPCLCRALTPRMA